MSNATDLAAATGQCIQALAAVVGLGAIWWQVREARKATDVQCLQNFLRDVREHEDALLRASSESDTNQAFIEFLNFIETYSAAINGNLLPEVTRDIVRDKIIDVVAVITENNLFHDKLSAALTSKGTFKCLDNFMSMNKESISGVILARAKHRSSGRIDSHGV